MKRQTRTKMWRNGRNDDHILTVSRSGLGGEKVVFFLQVWQVWHEIFEITLRLLTDRR